MPAAHSHTQPARRFRTVCWWRIIGCLLAASSGLGASVLRDLARTSPSVTATWENDIILGRDGQFTSGVRLYWLSRDDPAEGAAGWPAMLGRIPPFSGRDRITTYGYTLGHAIFTPDDIDTANPPPDTRPYAGHLYLGASLHRRNERVLDMLEINIGMVGPAALAKEAQTFVHDLVSSRTPRGWGSQLPNEPTFQLVYERRWRAAEWPLPGALGISLVPHTGFSLGNAAVYAHAGARLQVGVIPPGHFGSGTIQRPGGSPAPPFAHAAPGRRSHQLFFGVDGRAVARNLFLDGSTFRSSRRVDREPWVADAFAGLESDLGRMKLTWALVWRSDEFTTQRMSQAFGSLSLSMPF